MFDNVLGGSVLIGDLDFLKDGEYIKPDQQFTATPCVETKDGEVIRGRTRTFATGNDGNGYSTTATFHAVD